MLYLCGAQSHEIVNLKAVYIFPDATVCMEMGSSQMRGVQKVVEHQNNLPSLC